MEIKEKPSISPEKSVVTPASPVADSRPAPSDLPGLRDWKATRSSSSIIEDRRAAQALAASRMAAKVAVDKLEARLADTSDNNSNRLKFYLEINGEAFTLVFSSVLTVGGPRAAAGYWVYQGDTRLGIIEHDDGEGHWIAHQEHLGKVRKGHFANAPAAVVYLYYLYMRRSHRVGIESHTPYLGIPPRNITTFRWSGPEQPRDLEDRRVDEEAHKLVSHARDQGGTLEMALEDFRDFDPSLVGEMGERVLNRAQDLDGEGATSAPRRRYRSSLNPYRRGDY